MGKQSKKKETQPHKSRVLLVDYDRTFDSLVYHIKQYPDERTRLWKLATTGFAATNERGMLVSKHHVSDEGEGNENIGSLRSPAELAAALEYWPHSRCIKDFPCYAPGRFDGRDGRPRGCPGSDFRYDPGYRHAVDKHNFSMEVLLAVFTLKNEDGSRSDNMNMGSFAAPVIIGSDGSVIQRNTESLKNMPNISHLGNEVKMNPYTITDSVHDGSGLGIRLEIPSTYCAREGCTICELPRKGMVGVGEDLTNGKDDEFGNQVVFKTVKENRVKLMVCSRCKTVKYCSRDCQKLDWKRHKTLCGTEQQPVTSAAAQGVL